MPETPLVGEEPTHVRSSGGKFIPGLTPLKSMELCHGFTGSAEPAWQRLARCAQPERAGKEGLIYRLDRTSPAVQV